MTRYILALDQGTTSSRAIVFGHDGRIVSMSQQELPQIIPAPGQVQHDPQAIWSTQYDVARQALAGARLEASQIAAIGIANQRETTILWEKATGKPVDQRDRLAKPCERPPYASNCAKTGWTRRFAPRPA